MEPKWRIVINGKMNWEHAPYLYSDIKDYTWTPLYSWVYRGQYDPRNLVGGGIEPNEASYTIKFQIAQKVVQRISET